MTCRWWRRFSVTLADAKAYGPPTLPLVRQLREKEDAILLAVEALFEGPVSEMQKRMAELEDLHVDYLRATTRRYL
jgi:hypothetical protein